MTMKKIETKKWSKFTISDLFDVERPNQRSRNKYDEGKVPYVSSGSYNNGIADYLTPIDENDIDKGNCITVSPVDGTAFYQKDDFLGRGGGGSSIVIFRNKNLNEYNGLFIATIITKSNNYQYNNMGQTDLTTTKAILLPTDGNGDPDWEYMESYVKSTMQRLTAKINSIKNVKSNKTPIESTGWKDFRIIDLFDVKGSDTTKKIDLDLDYGGDYPYVTTAGTNNGICGYSKFFTEEGNVITVDSAVLGTAFYQKENFTASDHVEKLIPKNFTMTENIALFLCTVLNSTGRLYGYAYNEKRSQKALKKETLKLPARSNGMPDFNYMEEYIEQIKKIAIDRINEIKMI